MNSECAEIEVLLQGRLDGECTPDEVTRVDGHLEGCGACREAWAELEALVGRLQGMYAQCEEEAPTVAVPGVPPGATRPAAAERASTAPTVVAGSLTDSAIAAATEALVASGYRIVAPIAKGGFGAVYRAVQLSLDRPVALKLLAPHLADNQEFVARFMREAKVAAALNHPNLVAIYDVGQQGQQLYYAMELVEGTDAEALLKQEGFVPQRRAAEICAGVARALAAAARAGIVHRDVKPANVLLTPQGGVKLADLGLAKATENDGSGDLTLKKKVIGSPNYMSPEQAQDIRQATPRSDVYSLGATLLHMVSGRVPFGTGSPVEVLSRVLRDQPELPELLPSGEKLDPTLRGLIQRALHKDPAQRPEAEAFAAALEAWLKGEAAPAELTDSARVASGRRGQSKKVRRPSSDRAGALDSSSRLAVHRGGGSGAVARPARGGLSVALAAAAVLLTCVGLLIAFKGAPAGGEVAEQGQPVPATPPVRGPEPRQTPRRADPPRVVPNQRPATAPGERQDAQAEAALLDLRRWRDEHPEEAGERWRRARELAQSFPGTSAAAEAEELRRAAEADLSRSLDAAQGLANQLEAQERLGEARDALLAFLDRSGEEAPQGVQARVLVSALEAKLDVKVEADLSELERLLASADPEGARKVVGRIQTYAGGLRGAKAQERLDGWLASAAEKKPAPSGGAVAAQGPPPGGKDGVGPDGKPASPAGAEGQALLAQARGAIEKREWAAAREALKKLRELGKQDPALQGETEALTAALDKALTPPEAGVLLAAWLHGQVKSLGGNRVEVRYDFESEAQGADWLAAGGFEGTGAKLQEVLEGQIKPPSGLKEPWAVKKGALLAYGWTRRRFVAALRTDEPIKLEVKARGNQNVVVALQDPGKARSALVAVNYVMDELPLNQIATEVWKGGGRGGGGELQRRVGEMKRWIDATRKRGPALVLAREDGFLNLEELHDQAMSPASKPGFSVELRPEGKERHVVVIAVGRKELPAIELEEPDAIWLTLASLGAAVAWDEVTITGTVREDVVERLRNAAKEVGAEPEVLRKKLQDDEARKAKDEEERKKQEEEARRRRREGGMGGGPGGPGGPGGAGGAGGEGEKKGDEPKKDEPKKDEPKKD